MDLSSKRLELLCLLIRGISKMSKVLEIKTESSDSYAKFAMIVIARYRFRAFVLKFQREPGPQEPIFFDERQDSPVKADLDTARAPTQLDRVILAGCAKRASFATTQQTLRA